MARLIVPRTIDRPLEGMCINVKCLVGKVVCNMKKKKTKLEKTKIALLAELSARLRYSENVVSILGKKEGLTRAEYIRYNWHKQRVEITSELQQRIRDYTYD